MTFMDVAEGSPLEDTKHRNHKNARKAYDAVLHHLEKLKPDVGQRRVIDAMLARLKTRLETAGEQTASHAAKGIRQSLPHRE
jgi:hypothetical protein